MAEAGHCYEFGPPTGGWPSFDEAGKRVDRKLDLVHLGGGEPVEVHGAPVVPARRHDGPPAGGWPDFDDDGKRIRTETQKRGEIVYGCDVPGHPNNFTHEHEDNFTHEHEDQAGPEEKRLLAALWEIRMAAERATVGEPPWALPTRIIGLAEAAMGTRRRLAQELAAVSQAAAVDLKVGASALTFARGE